MARRIPIRRSLSMFMLAALLGVTSVTALFTTESAFAANRPEGVAFFNDTWVGSSSRAVVWYDDGRYGGNSMPTFNNKDEFINHIRWLLGGDGSPWQWRNQTGAQYIVQRMREGSDFSRPNAAAVDDWEARLRQSNVTMANEVTTDAQTSGFIQIGGYDGGADTVANRDDVAYTKSSNINTDLTLAFYQDGSLVFRIRYNCGNPLGSTLPGIEGPNFNLNPTIRVDPDVAESGSTATVSPSVFNSGTTPSSPVTWQVSRFQLAVGAGMPGGGINGTAPEAHYGNGATSVAGGSYSFPTNLHNWVISPQTLGDVAVGTRICFALSVRPYTHTGPNWRHSTPECVTIAKKPKVQVEGSDVFVGKGMTSNIVTSTVTKNGLTYGSWGEYAVAATGRVTGMASGAGWSGGNGAANFCLVSYLTITNAGTGSCNSGTTKGNYALSAALPDVAARFPNPQNTGGVIDVSTVANGVYNRNGAGSIRVRASTDVAPGRWVVINAPGTNVIIEENIRYTSGALSSLADIPQVVIIADSIEIEPAVSRIDSWLVASGASGRINTCRGIPYPLNAVDDRLYAGPSGPCDTQLVVNGPVMARQLLLYRTHGSGVGADSGVPAERFNLRPDAYLWATNFNTAAGRIQTVSSKELPPRF